MTIQDISVLPFTHAEYANRVGHTRAEMERRGLDLLLVNAPVSLNYLTGMECGTSVAFLALPARGEAFLVVRKTELSNAHSLSEVSPVKSAIGVDDSEDPALILAQAIQTMSLPHRVIGIEEAGVFLTVSHYLELRRQFPHSEWHDATDIVGSLRTVKSPAELEYMRQAGRIAAKATETAIGSIHEGMLDSELGANLISAAILAGSAPMPKLPYVTTGERTFLAHSSWNGSPIRSGDIINTELPATVQHYNAVVFRVSVLGKPSDQVLKLHQASQAGLLAGLDSIGPGMTSHQADKVVRDKIEEYGAGEFFVVRAAYGIGLGFPPSWSDSYMQIRPNDQRKLEAGMCFHLVPALYQQGLGAVCCSMSIEITENGCKPLTPIEPKLFLA